MRVKVPTLKGYEAAIASNDTMTKAFSNLGETSNAFANQLEIKKQNKIRNIDWAKAFKKQNDKGIK